MQILHLLKHDLLPDACHSWKCPSCTEEVNPDDVDVVRTLTIADTQKLFDSEDQMKHKVIYIAGYIAKNHKQTDEDDSEECVSSTFLDELNRGGMTVPNLSTAFFVHCGVHAQVDRFSEVTMPDIHDETLVIDICSRCPKHACLPIFS